MTKYVTPMEWLRQVITRVTEHDPLVVHEQTSLAQGRYVVSLSINSAGTREQIRGETVVIHVDSISAQQPHVAACDAVRKALIQIENQTNHVIPDYSYFKIKAFQNGEVDVTQMPKQISPAYESNIVRLLHFIRYFKILVCNYCYYMSTNFFIAYCLTYLRTHSTIASCTLMLVCMKFYVKY